MSARLSRRSLLAATSTAAALMVAPAGSASAGAPSAGAPSAGSGPAGSGATGPGFPGSAVGGAAGRLRREYRARLAVLEREYSGRIGGFAVDTGTGATVSYRAGERFPLLSTFKVLAGGAVLRKSRYRDPGLLDRVIHWTEEDLVEYSPITSQHVADGLTVERLCHAAIAYSDNTAGNLLLAQLGGPGGLTRYLRILGDPVTRLDRWETALNDWEPGERRDTTTPAAMGWDLRALTVGRALEAEDRTRLIGWMRESTTGAARIRAGLPPDWLIGDKTGSSQAGYAGANDVAIAAPPSSAPPSSAPPSSAPPSSAPLIISIYTNRSSPELPFDNAVIATTATILVGALGKL